MKTHQSSLPSVFSVSQHTKAGSSVCGAPTGDISVPTLPAWWEIQTPEEPQRSPKAGLTGAVHLSLLFSPAHRHECSERTAVGVDGDRGDGTPTQRRFVLQDWVESDNSPPTVSLHVPARQDGLQRDAAGHDGRFTL